MEPFPPPQTHFDYTYDPFSRLQAKREKGETFYYLHDKEHEIGLVDAQGNLLELPVLGLGIRGEIGAAVALELDGHLFIPLHDFQGNVVALINSGGVIVETFHFDPFGNDTSTTPHRNPWRFSSKRTEAAGLIFFGIRFYDPMLGRFLTPDPSGFDSEPLFLPKIEVLAPPQGMTQAIGNKIPEGTLLLGIHNKTKGFPRDANRLRHELYRKKDFPIIRSMRAILPGIASELGKSNEKALMLHIMHSENGLITCRAIEGMEDRAKDLMHDHALFLGYGTVLPAPNTS